MSIKLEPLPDGSLSAELQRRLDTALEFEGWQEAEMIYHEVHGALAGAEAPRKARALMDHARVLRRVGKAEQAAVCEAKAEALMGGPIEREAEALSSTDELQQAPRQARGWFSKFFGK